MAISYGYRKEERKMNKGLLALYMYAFAAAISFFIAFMIKGIYLGLRLFKKNK
jgi:hypothetical protein